VAYNMGKNSFDKKERFVGRSESPKFPNDVLHLYNFNTDKKYPSDRYFLSVLMNLYFLLFIQVNLNSCHKRVSSNY